MSAVLKDPPLPLENVIALLETEIRRGGTIELMNGCIYFDALWEEDTGGMHGDRVEIEVRPSFVREKFVNGQRLIKAYDDLLQALRGLE